MKKMILLVVALAIFLMLMVPNINAVKINAVGETFENKAQTIINKLKSLESDPPIGTKDTIFELLWQIFQLIIIYLLNFLVYIYENIVNDIWEFIGKIVYGIITIVVGIFSLLFQGIINLYTFIEKIKDFLRDIIDWLNPFDQ